MEKVDKYLKMFRDAKAFENKRFDEYVELQAFYEGQQYLLSQYAEPKPWVVDINTPYASDAIDVRVASLQANDYIGKLQPLSPQDVEIIEKLNQAYENKWVEMNMDDKINNAIERAAVLREAYIHITYDKDSIVGTRNRNTKGKLEAYFIDPASVNIDPNALEFRDADYIFITERISKIAAERLYPNVEFGNRDTLSQQDRGEIYLDNNYTESGEGIFTKLTCYEKEKNGIKRTCIIANNVVSEEDLPITIYPIAQLRWQKRLKSPYGLGLMDRLLALQKSINSIESAYTNVALAFSAPSFIVSEDSNIDPNEVAATAGMPGVTFKASGDIDKAVRRMIDSAIDPNLVNIKKENEMTILKMAGVTSQFEGDIGSAGNTSGGTEQAIARAKMIENKFIVQLEKFIEDLTHIVVEYITNVYAGETLYTRGQEESTGQYKFQEIQVPEETMLEGLQYTFGINLSVKTPYSKERTKQQLIELWQMENQYQAPIKTITVLDLLKAMELPEREELVDRYVKLSKRSDANKAQAVLELSQLGLQYNLPPDMLQQAIVEIVSGAAETPVADQLMAMVEQQVQQQNQVIDQGQQKEIDMMLQQQVQSEQPTGDEEISLQK